MTRRERRHIEQLITRAEETRRLFSEAGREWCERVTCAMFLRALGVPFAPEELRWMTAGQDPPDVRLRDACFEICECLDEGRRRHDEVKADIQRYRQARTFDDVLVAPSHPRPMAYHEVYDHLLAALAEKAARYGPQGCAGLDALVYVQLHGRFPLPDGPLPDATSLRQQGWRSVSFVMWISSHVVYAIEAAPAFLRAYVGQTRREWEDAATFFSL